jgi:signal transduction histidine kinase
MASLVKHCLLVVDDEPDLVQSVKDLLRFDYRVLCATRASDGLSIMEREKVHIVMSDQRMPEMTGVQFLASLKQNFPETVRLLFTAYADLQAVTDAINQGNVYRYIAKPWEPDELKTVLRQAVDFYDLQEERRRLLIEVSEKNRQLEQANHELSRANDLKQAFIRVASHELRTPLTIIMGLSELSQHQRGVPAPVDDWLRQMYRSSLRLTERVDLVVKMLQAQRFERPLQPHGVDLAELVRGAGGDVMHFIQQRRQKLEMDLPADLGLVFVEKDKIHDSIVQLLVNAIKFTPDQGTIRVAARRTEDAAAEITVSDTGTGIEPECLPRIFEPFFTRYDVSRHSSGDFEFDRRGLGLGLAMVKTFVEMHGGQVRVHSEVGKGATFTLRLPVADGEAANAFSI